MTAAWFHAERSGEGFVIEVLEDGRGLVYWFGYRPDDPDAQSWLFGEGVFSGMRLEALMVQPVGGGFGDQFDPDAVERVVWGDVRMDFGFDGSARAQWSSVLPGYGSGSIDLIRLTRPPPAPACPEP